MAILTLVFIVVAMFLPRHLPSGVCRAAPGFPWVCCVCISYIFIIIDSKELKCGGNCILFFFADFALQNMVETTLPDGLETSGRRVYR